MFYKPITILCLLCCLLLNLQAYATKDLVATSATESQRAMDHQRGIDFLQNEDDHSTYSQNFGNAVARYYGYALSSYGSGYGSAKINNPSSINQNYYASNNKEFSRLDKQKGANRQLLDEEVHKIYELSKIYSEKKNMPLEKGTAIVSKAFYGLVDKDANDMYETNLNTQDALEYLEAQDFLKSKIDYSSTTTTYDGELSGLGWALKEQYNDRYSNLKGYSRNKKFYEKYLKIDNQADTSSGSGSAGGIKNFADGFKKPYKDLANEATNNTLEFLKATAIGILLTPKTGFDFGENLHKTHEKANIDDLLGDRQSRDQKRGEIAGNIAPIAAGGTIGGILKKGKNAHRAGEAGRAAKGAGTTKLPTAVGETTLTQETKGMVKNTNNSIATFHPLDFITTHELTMSKREFKDFKNYILKNGIKESIKYVEYDGKKYIVDGHHRLQAAKELSIKNIPAEKVDLPYAGYKTFRDLLE